jgi:cell division protein FtsB
MKVKLIVSNILVKNYSMNKLIISFIFILFALQISLWNSETGIPKLIEVKDNIQNKTKKIEQQILKNNLKKNEVIELKKGYKVIEQKARYELGLIKKGEIFILRNEWQD